MSDKMPLSEIRRILERGEWWDNVRDVSPDEPRPWLDELNGAIEAALDELQAYHDAEVSGKFLQAGDVVYWPKLQIEGADFTRVDTILITEVCKWHGAISFNGIRLHERWTDVDMPFKTAIMGHCGFCDSDIGKYVWLTREEAEAALEELEARYARTTDKAQS